MAQQCSDAYIRALSAYLRPSDHILAETAEVPRHYRQDEAGPQRWRCFPWFAFGQNALYGTQRFQEAMDEGYLDLVVLHDKDDLALVYAIDPILSDGSHYLLIVKQPHRNLV